MSRHITLTDINAGTVSHWCNQRGAHAVVRGGPEGGSIGGSVIVRTEAAHFTIEPGDTVRDLPGVGLALTEGVDHDRACEEVWMVVRVGVYDQGVAYVATSQEKATEFTNTFAPDNDGYHSWEIRQARLDEPLEPEAEAGDQGGNDKIVREDQ